MRTWLIRLAPIVLAVLQLAVPRAAVAAQLDQCREPTRLAPRSDVAAKPVLARLAARAGVEQLSRLAPFLSATTPQVTPPGTIVVYRGHGAAPRRPDSTVPLLPHSRAPPAQS